MSAWTRLSLLLQDNSGNIAKVVFALAAAVIDPSDSIVTTIRTAVVGVTKALSPRAEIGTQAGPTGATTAGTGAFSAIEDRAVFTFRADDGSTLNMEVPAPKPAIFTTGSSKLDLSNTAVIAWADFIGANACSQFGLNLTLVSGERTRKKQMKH